MFSYLFGISRRWEMVFLLFSCILILYTLRVNMSVAVSKMKDDLNWDDDEKGLVLSSFYWGYAAGQIPAALYAQKYGAKWLFGFSLLITSFLTLLIPLAAGASIGWLLILRCMVGFFESASFPAVFHMFIYWIPKSEKTIMVPVTYCGMYAGEVVGFSASGYLVESTLILSGIQFGGWSSVFYVFGLAGILWFPIWAIFAYDRPTDHPYITKEELDLMAADTNIGDAYQQNNGYHSIASASFASVNDSDVREVNSSDRNDPQQQQQQQQKSVDKLPLVPIYNYNSSSSSKVEVATTSLTNHRSVSDSKMEEIPWKAFATNKVALTIFMNSWTFGFIGFMLLSEMPSYLTDELDFDIASAGLLCIAPYLSMFFVTLTAGAIFEWLQVTHDWKARDVRQWAQFIALGGSGGMLLIGGFLPEKYAAYAFVVVGQALLGVCQCGVACTFLEVAPRFSGIMNTVGNTIGAVAGIFGPIIVALFVDTWHGVWGWRAVFILTAAMCAVSLALWRRYQTSDIVPELNTPVKSLKMMSEESGLLDGLMDGSNNGSLNKA